MKRIISLVLACVLVLGLCACAGGSGSGGGDTAGTTGAAGATFMAGYGKVDITPAQYGVGMGGYGNEAVRLSTGLLSYIYAIAVAVTDADGNTAVMMSVDQCSISTAYCTEIRKWAYEEYGIPEENILISSIHQHSTPVAGDGNYHAQLMQGLKDAITAALEDRAPAEMYINKVETVALSFVRRFWANDGSFVSSHSGDGSSGYAGYESESDKEMRLIKFTREDANDIIMVNFQGHPHMGTSSSMTDIHSDWPGVMRDEVAAQLGADCIYFSGAGGNMNSSSRIKEDMVDDGKDFRAHGKYAAQYVIDAEDSYTKAETGTVVCVEETQIYDVDHSLDHLLPVAILVNDVRKTEGIAAAHVYVKEFPELNSTYQASAIVTKASLGPTKTLTYTVITFGDVAFSAHPYEMFDTNGKELRDGTVGNENYAADEQLENPFAMHFVTSISNGAEGYIPSYYGFSNGGYERDTTRYAQGTGEQIVGDVLKVLNSIRK